jgi:hypothetical protein
VFVTVTLPVNAEVLTLPSESDIDPEATVMTAVPPLEGDAVNVAV